MNKRTSIGKVLSCKCEDVARFETKWTPSMASRDHPAEFLCSWGQGDIRPYPRTFCGEQIGPHCLLSRVSDNRNPFPTFRWMPCSDRKTQRDRHWHKWSDNMLNLTTTIFAFSCNIPLNRRKIWSIKTCYEWILIVYLTVSRRIAFWVRKGSLRFFCLTLGGWRSRWLRGAPAPGLPKGSYWSWEERREKGIYMIILTALCMRITFYKIIFNEETTVV